MIIQTIPLYFEWVQLEPDTRQYKPVSPQLVPLSITIKVDIPFSGDYIHNMKDIEEAVAQNPGYLQQIPLTKPNPILTIKGMRFVEEALIQEEHKEDNWKDTEEFDSDNDFNWD